MEEDIKILKNIIEQDFSNPMGWSGYYDSELKELQQAIRNLINKNKELRQEVAEHERREGQQNQNMVSALEEAFKYSLEIKDLEIKNKELEKMVELMAFSLADYVMYYEYDKCRNPEMIKAKANEEINYFKKKASEENG